MRHLTKLLIVLSFGVVTAFAVLSESEFWPSSAQVKPTSTPPANAANAAPDPAKPPAQPASTPPTVSGDKTIPKTFTLGKDSQDEHGEVPFDHDTHAFKPYSPDGKSPIACVECHHTDQPKSALKPPLSTSERDVVMTIDSWRASTAKVKTCRECHFQTVNIPDGAKMPTATVTERGKEVTKDLNNELAYHINCNTCHDAAAKLRPEVKSRPGFATSTDCKTCHRPN
ncbi:MAG TPA: cytochrome c3 family protein [Pyrinomonadaceae bacterium]|nr:cytochrome c3 family protein [Pyrinomonadaceae bacterium]